ncbi:MAG: cytochrome c [Rhodoferax sp.]|nr:cytochrome c [Rhodoferax sp.]
MAFLPHPLTRTLLVIAAGAVLTACGGGGSSGGSATGSTVSGVAATGLAIDNGQVTLKCTIGSTPAVSTQADGSYSVDVSHVTLPCVARVDFTDRRGRHGKLHSLVKLTGNVNITPVTDMLVANLSSSGVSADAYDKFDADEVKGFSEARVTTATRLLKTHLESKGVDTSRLPDDVIGSKFVPATTERMGDDHDHVLDDIQAKLEEEGKDLGELENEMEAGHETRGLSTSTGLPGDAVAGKAAYEASCLGCHGARMADAVNSYKTLRAIQENEGGMGYLASTITTVTADNIATYLANGVGSGTGTALQTQSITFASPGNQTMGVATPALVATATSGLPVTITSTTTAVCTVANTALTLVAPGTCSLRATQTGNATYTAAVPVVNTLTVASATGAVLTSQAITFASPGAQTVGTPANLLATSDSGLTVTLATTTSSVCTVSGNTLTPLAAGNCTVTADQAGNTNYAAAATVSRTFAVNNPAVLTSATTGKTLYANCSGCHGAAASNTMNVLAGANSPSTIQAAISNNMGGMGRLSNLTTQNLADIAAYLATPNI